MTFILEKMVDIWTEFCGQNSTKCVLNDKLKIQRSMPVSNKRMEEKYMRMKCKRIISLVVIISLFFRLQMSLRIMKIVMKTNLSECPMRSLQKKAKRN